eukprot:13002276-Alexandrium_andersonii.AAC.1
MECQGAPSRARVCNPSQAPAAARRADLTFCPMKFRRGGSLTIFRSSDPDPIVNEVPKGRNC